jgi:hypothetical protein
VPAPGPPPPPPPQEAAAIAQSERKNEEPRINAEKRRSKQIDQCEQTYVVIWIFISI